MTDPAQDYFTPHDPPPRLGDDVIDVFEKTPPAKSRLGLQLSLLALTCLTTTFAGVGIAHGLAFSLLSFSPAAPFVGLGPVLNAIVTKPQLLVDGLAFSAPLMAILLVHEMGHYLVARSYGVAASLPYFIPFPMGLGTLGAIIGMRANTRDRGVLLDIGAAGPMAGFVVAFVVLLVGFAHSEVKTAAELSAFAAGGNLVVEGDSLIYGLARWLVHGRLAPGADVWIHPTVWAGWVGLYLTWFNLQPFGQFDGGHVSAAVFGPRAIWLARGVFVYLGLLFVLSFNFFWLVLSVIMVVLGQFIGVAHPPLDPLPPLRWRHKLVAGICALLFFGTLVPNPWHQVKAPAPSAVVSEAGAQR